MRNKIRPAVIIVMKMNRWNWPWAVFYKEFFSAYYMCKDKEEKDAGESLKHPWIWYQIIRYQFTKAFFILQKILHIICVKIKRRIIRQPNWPVSIMMRMNRGIPWAERMYDFYFLNYFAYYICNKEKPRESGKYF